VGHGQQWLNDSEAAFMSLLPVTVKPLQMSRDKWFFNPGNGFVFVFLSSLVAISSRSSIVEQDF
jgi:hypothetical protein